MRHATIDFTVSPVTYSPQMKFAYWWNHPRHEAVSYPKPLTREQSVQGQAILKDIASLPQHLRYRYQKRYQSLISEKGLHEAHHFLYFTFHQKIWPRLSAVNQRYEMQVANWPVTLIDTPDILDFNLLPDMNNQRLKQLASHLSAFFFSFYERCCDQIITSHQGDRDRIFDETVQTDIYRSFSGIGARVTCHP